MVGEQETIRSGAVLQSATGSAVPQQPGLGKGLFVALLHADAARPARFIITGGAAGLIQIGLLAALTGHGWHSLLANPVAFLLAAQVNFALSTLFTWRDRRDGQSLLHRWLLFHGSIAGMALLNMAVFAAARTRLPDLESAALGIATAALGNYLVGDRLVFRRRALTPADPDDRLREEDVA
jgi:putative flippase GtrA